MMRQQGFGGFQQGFQQGYNGLPDALKWILTISVGVYIIQAFGTWIPIADQNLNRWIIDWLGFEAIWPGSPFHLLFNMLWLFFLGRAVEESLGPRTFLVLFLGAGLGGALLSVILGFLAPFTVMIGASGAVYGIMVVFAMMYPRTPMMMLFLPPIEARYLVAGIIGIDLLLLGSADGVARLAHLGGALSGFGMYRLQQQGTDLSGWIRPIERLWSEPPSGKARRRTSTMSDATILEEEDEVDVRREIDELLDKVAKNGYDGLSKEEKRRLFDASQKR
jgi:membrane associated rhomboid family serine protease